MNRLSGSPRQIPFWLYFSGRISLNNLPTLKDDLRGIFCRRLAYLKVKYLISDETMQQLLGHAQGINFEVKSHSVLQDLKEINNLNIGPMGLGGKVTALAVKIQKYPTHIAGLPVSVNISCHALRSAQIIL